MLVKQLQFMTCMDGHVSRPGADTGGGGSWGSGPPFFETPKVYKEGRNVPRCARIARVLIHEEQRVELSSEYIT